MTAEYLFWLGLGYAMAIGASVVLHAFFAMMFDDEGWWRDD